MICRQQRFLLIRWSWLAHSTAEVPQKQKGLICVLLLLKTLKCLKSFWTSLCCISTCYRKDMNSATEDWQIHQWWPFKVLVIQPRNVSFNCKDQLQSLQVVKVYPVKYIIYAFTLIDWITWYSEVQQTTHLVTGTEDGLEDGLEVAPETHGLWTCFHYWAREGWIW